MPDPSAASGEAEAAGGGVDRTRRRACPATFRPPSERRENQGRMGRHPSHAGRTAPARTRRPRNTPFTGRASGRAPVPSYDGARHGRAGRRRGAGVRRGRGASRRSVGRPSRRRDRSRPWHRRRDRPHVRRGRGHRRPPRRVGRRQGARRRPRRAGRGRRPARHRGDPPGVVAADRRARRDRRPRQQRRDPAHHAAARHHRRGVGPRDGRQRPLDARHDPGRRPIDDRRRDGRADHQHVEHGRQAGRRQPGALRGVEGGGRVADPGRGDRARPARRSTSTRSAPATC